MFTQYSLPYGYGSLEPHIDELTMVTHYTKHHAGYTNNLNAAVDKVPELSGSSIEEILGKLDSISDPAIRTAIRNNGGGYWNHNLYFSILSPEASPKPSGELLKRIDSDFGSFDRLVEQVSALAATRFGSGWAWVSVDTKGKLTASSTPNQDNPLMDGSNLTPILGIDVWEHAYYLKYKNLRADYIKAFWQVVDWNAVTQRYEAALL
ncbi:MAG: superoxide dismutase [Spirochaetae bacterium HGW-Spirochaetae-4]|jgi:Fe-Mn family superoxide dismutase|nr:MAG: superoxide dismutase [Spirochaetes bacterium GWC2_52_13]PKL20091.1 MAG: superoxide dismutase [Spirochaetae bacterium HGW-Spirochaetae-4]HCG63888.1 superoxide dismutase [Sphaerochaeta sp.]HCS37636.1 superoxide dismutase [Sphaerochaeta sp.]